MSKARRPSVEAEYSPNYRKINVNRVVGGLRPGFFEIDIVSEETNYRDLLSEDPIILGQGKEVLKRTIECKLIMDPFQTKEFLRFLTLQIQRYEKLMGEIPTDEVVNKNIKKLKKEASG
jgi:hypothetical protein